jgi:hypothetical protein
MLNLACVWDDRRYGPEAVLILRDMIARNLPDQTEGQFICFTDFEDDLGPWVEKRPLSAHTLEIPNFPLNCVIVRALDCLLEGQWPATCFYDGPFPERAAIVLFEDGRPQDHDGWVRHVYKIGGGTIADLKFTPNVPKQDLVENIRSAIVRDSRWFEPRAAHDGVAVIVGGGPSLAADIPLLSYFVNTSTLFAVNGVPAYLECFGIIPDIHVMLDAEPGCLRFVSPNLPMTRYYASQCAPAILDAAGSSLVCWHGGGDAMTAIEGHLFRNVIGGGSTAASRAVTLAYGLGYRKFHLFGLDSSYDGDRSHAYDQAGYDNLLDVTCGDQVFKASPQLLGQAEDFKVLIPDLVRAACEVTVHGGGLLRAIASQMAV